MKVEKDKFDAALAKMLKAKPLPKKGIAKAGGRECGLSLGAAFLRGFCEGCGF